MTERVDLFPGFREQRVTGDGVMLHCRIGGDGPPLVLLHGYPQCHVMWHKIAPQLARSFTCIIPDLRGYGLSGLARRGSDPSVYSKRTMAGDIIAMTADLGYRSFAVVGHDRGARVGYRLALDRPETVTRLAVLDILPTYDYWQRMDREFGLKIYHWLFLAQPEPFPEMLIARAPVQFLDHTLASWTKAGNLSAFDDRALAYYRDFFSDPERIHATCQDYRAGATVDLAADTSNISTGTQIDCPVLAIWGGGGIAQESQGPLETWRKWAKDVRGGPVDSGHFVAEENPDETLAALMPFLDTSS